MYKVIILAVLLTLGACALKKQSVHFQDTKTVLAELDKDPLGNTLLSAIAVNMKAKQPMEEITLFLEEIVNSIQTAQSQADSKNQTEEATCQEQQTNFNKQINEQTATIAALETSITENTVILTQATADLEQANKDYDEVVTAIQTGTAQREAEHSTWADQDYKQSVEIATLEEGVKLIQHMIHGVAFAQIKTRYEKVLEKLQKDDGKHSTLFKPVIIQLTQLASKLNYENVMKILDLLNGIREAIVQDQTNARLAEETAQADWEILFAQLDGQKRSLSDKKQRLGNLIEATTSLLKQLKESLEQHKVELENLQLSLASVVAFCQQESLIYTTESAQRANDVAILTKLLNHLNEKGGAVSDYVENRSI